MLFTSYRLYLKSQSTVACYDRACYNKEGGVRISELFEYDTKKGNEHSLCIYCYNTYHLISNYFLL